MHTNKNVGMNEVSSTDDFYELSGCPFGNFHGGPPIDGGGFGLGAVFGNTNLHATSHTRIALDEMLGTAKSMEAQQILHPPLENSHVGPAIDGNNVALGYGRIDGVVGDKNVLSTLELAETLDGSKLTEAQLIPTPQQYPSSSVTFQPDLSESYDPSGISEYILEYEKSPHYMSILPRDIMVGSTPEFSPVSLGLTSNNSDASGALPEDNKKRATGVRKGSAALKIKGKKQLQASRNREHANQSRIRAKKKKESMEARFLAQTMKNKKLKAILDSFYEQLKAKKSLGKKKSKYKKGSITIDEGLKIAEETMKRCVETYKPGSGSGTGDKIKERKNN